MDDDKVLIASKLINFNLETRSLVERELSCLDFAPSETENIIDGALPYCENFKK